MCTYKQQLQIAIEFVSNYLKSYVNVTSFYISLGVSSSGCLVIFLGNQFSSFLNTKMAYKRIIVMPANYLGFDDLRQVWKIFPVQYSINIFSAFFQALSPIFLSFRVLCLQLKQSQPWISNTSLVIRSFTSQFPAQIFLKLIQPRQYKTTADENLIKWKEVIYFCLVLCGVT